MKNRKGFTLIELMIVLVIISILTKVGLASFHTTIKAVKDVEAENVIGAIMTAESMYYMEYNSYTESTGKLAVQIPAMKYWATPTLDVDNKTGTLTVSTDGKNSTSTIRTVTGTLTTKGARSIATTEHEEGC